MSGGQFKFVIAVQCICYLTVGGPCVNASLLVMDALAHHLMKGVVNCIKLCKLQRSVNHLDIECGLCCLVSLAVNLLRCLMLYAGKLLVWFVLPLCMNRQFGFIGWHQDAWNDDIGVCLCGMLCES